MDLKLRILILILISATLPACDNASNSSSATDPDNQLKQIISLADLTGNPASGKNFPDISSPLAQLGMKLFFTKGLGGDMDTACASCHHPKLGGGDNLSLSIGVEAEIPDLLGPGRKHSSSGTNYDGGPTVPRNAPTTFNIGLWDKVLFHDGRIEQLSSGGIITPDSTFSVLADPNAGNNVVEAQARFPVTSPEEMRGFTFEANNTNQEVRTHLEERFQGVVNELLQNNWLSEFQQGFNDPSGTAASLITYPKIAEAIAEYELSQIFTNNKWKAYVQGNSSAISEDAKRGAILFLTSIENGGAGCESCHKGDFFTDEQFHVIAIPQIGRGKGDGISGNDDFGRFKASPYQKNLYAFRTPTLLNVEVTGPWGHTGSYSSLEAIIRHHLNPQFAVDNYDFNQIDPSIDASDMKSNTQKALDKLNSNRTSGQFNPVLKNISLSDTQILQLVEFLKTLTDPCVVDDACIHQWIPDSSDADPDLLRLNAVDFNGQAL